MATSIGSVIRQVREVRRMSSVEAARSAIISPAYLSKLENDAVKRPSPHVLHRLSEALDVPYEELMRLAGYHVPGASDTTPAAAIGAALFTDLTDTERDELVDYLAWYRHRAASRRSVERAG